MESKDYEQYVKLSSWETDFVNPDGTIRRETVPCVKHNAYYLKKLYPKGVFDIKTGLLIEKVNDSKLFRDIMRLREGKRGNPKHYHTVL